MRAAHLVWFLSQKLKNGSMTMKILKRALSLFIVGLFVFTAFAVIQSGGNQAQASPSASTSFTFPYQYGTPTVPSDVGAQGIQGPNVPLSTLGAPSSVLSLNQSIPSWWITPPANVTFTVNVYNGTLSSHTAGVGISVSLENTTTSKVTTELTSASGVASFEVSPGWYVIIAGTKSASYENFTQTIFISGGSKTIYMIPSSYGTVAINNGGTGVIWASYDSYLNLISPYGTSYPQMNLTLYNNTSPNSGKILGYGSTLSNGTVEFTGINDTYGYYIGLDGYSNPLSGITYGLVNATLGGGFTPSSAVYVISDTNPLRYYTSSSATVVGTPIPVTNATSSGSNNWVITQNTTVSNGTVVLGSKIYFGNPDLSITFENVDLINKFSAGFVGDRGNFTLINSTFFSMPHSSDNVILNNNAPTNMSIAGSTICSSYFDVTGRIDISHSHLYNPFFAFLKTNKNATISYSYINRLATQKYFASVNASFVVNSGISAVNFNNSYIIGIFYGAATNGNHDTLSNITYSSNGYSYSFSNISYSVVTNFAETSLNPPSYGMGVTYMYNDWIDFNYTTDDFLSLKTPNLAFSGNSSHLYVNHSLFYADGMMHFNFYGNSSLSHDMFTNFVPVNAIGSTTAQMFNENYKTSITYSNDTFGTVYYNQSLMETVSPHYYIGMGEFIEDMNQGNPKFPLSYLNVTHNTFMAVPIGDSSYAPQTAPVAVLLGEGNVQSNVSDNLFMNDYKYDQGPNATTITPYTWDIVDWAGYNYIYNNVFENLNNQIIPIGSNNNESGQQGYGSITGGHSINHIGGNLFYYHPSPIESYVPLGNITSEQNAAQIGQIAYQMPTFYNDSVSLNNPQYIFNTSKIVTAPLWSLKIWIYNITPDVAISNGNPIISYSNGLVGGPQPNFIWKGYDYTESIEPTYIQVGVNSSKAPPVDLQFSGVPGIQYVVQIISHGSEIESFIENASSSGILNATYNPATMPLDPTFEVSPYVAPPPPYNPVQPNPPMDFFPAYVFYILLTTSAAGVAAGIYIMIRRR